MLDTLMFLLLALGTILVIFGIWDKETIRFAITGAFIVFTWLTVFFGAIDFEKRQAIKAGAAEWRQVVKEDGSVENEFHYISSKPVEKAEKIEKDEKKD